MQEVPEQTRITVPEQWHRNGKELVGVGVGVTGVGVTRAKHHQGRCVGHEQPPAALSATQTLARCTKKSDHQLRARGEPGPPAPAAGCQNHGRALKRWAFSNVPLSVSTLRSWCRGFAYTA